MSTLQLLPAVDVRDGQAVRLVQGKAGSETTYGAPLAAALAWQADGAEWIHLVDLDAAFGRGSNAALLAEVVGVLDVNGFYQPLLAFLDSVVSNGFLTATHREHFLSGPDPEELLERFDSWEPTTVSKWLGPEDR